jgi:hypothetical protein
MMALLNDDVVLRAITTSDWLCKGEGGAVIIKDDAFYRRDPKRNLDLEGISVSTDHACAISNFRSIFTRGISGVGRLTIANIRSCGLDVRITKGNHGNINTALPSKWDPDPSETARAHKLAATLARLAIYDPCD